MKRKFETRMNQAKQECNKIIKDRGHEVPFWKTGKLIKDGEQWTGREYCTVCVHCGRNAVLLISRLNEDYKSSGELLTIDCGPKRPTAQSKIVGALTVAADLCCVLADESAGDKIIYVGRDLTINGLRSMCVEALASFGVTYKEPEIVNASEKNTCRE